MGATASCNDDFPDNHSDPHHFDISSRNVHPAISSIDPDTNDEDDFSIAELKWNFGGHSVYVTGAWDGWNNKYALYRTHQSEFTAVLLLPVGTFQYKFIVDGNWKHSPSLPTERDAHGNLNNIITIVARPKEFDSNDLPHDDMAPLIVDNYDFSILPQEDHTTEPPNIPRMLSSAPLDRYSRPNAPTPDFVRLNHVFETDSDSVYGPDQVRTLATELRYKSKVITTVLITSNSEGTPPIPPETQHHRPQEQQQPHYQPELQQHQLHHLQPEQLQQPQYHAASAAANVRPSESQSLIMDALNNV